MRLEFKCPVCAGARWGTDGSDVLSQTGHCNTSACGFSWPRADDFKYFRRVERATSRAQFEKWRDLERAGWQNAMNQAVHR